MREAIGPVCRTKKGVFYTALFCECCSTVQCCVAVCCVVATSDASHAGYVWVPSPGDTIIAAIHWLTDCICLQDISGCQQLLHVLMWLTAIDATSHKHEAVVGILCEDVTNIMNHDDKHYDSVARRCSMWLTKLWLEYHYPSNQKFQ